MRRLILSYLLLILLPAGGALLAGGILTRKELNERRDESAFRFAGLGALLFRTEMGDAAGEMALRAPVLPDPDPSSPVARAALAGDTIAALGTDSEGLVLSVALGEPGEEGDSASLRLRAVTEAFRPQALALLRSRTGYGTALYLRNRRALAEPHGFGPPRLDIPVPAPPGQADPLVVTEAGRGILLPLDPGAPGAMPVQILVAVPPGVLEPEHRLPSVLLLTLALALGGGMLLWAGTIRASTRGSPPVLVRILAAALPMAALWFALLSCSGSTGDRIREFQKGEMIRVLALLKGNVRALDPLEVAMATGYQVTLARPGSDPLSSLPPGPFLDRVLEIPPPPPTFPTTGTVPASEEPTIFAALREGPGEVLFLTTPSESLRLRGFLTTLLGIGGVATLLALLTLPRGPEDVIFSGTSFPGNRSQDAEPPHA